jgi:hypothetical protein
MTDLERQAIDELPSTAVLLERLRAENKQPTIKVKPCPGCGGLPHTSLGEYEHCILDALKEARVSGVLSAEERSELVTLRAKVERLEREIVDRSLQARGRG